jgi:hypothetical protein
MESLYEVVQRLRKDVTEYVDLGIPRDKALEIVREATCASHTAWQLVENEIVCSVCGSLVDVSKSGNLYCTAICWKNSEFQAEREREKIEAEAFLESYHGDWGDRD